MSERYRVGVDIGGTFTDIVLLGADGTLHTKKISSSVGIEVPKRLVYCVVCQSETPARKPCDK